MPANSVSCTDLLHELVQTVTSHLDIEVAVLDTKPVRTAGNGPPLLFLTPISCIPIFRRWALLRFSFYILTADYLQASVSRQRLDLAAQLSIADSKTSQLPSRLNLPAPSPGRISLENPLQQPLSKLT